MQRFLAKESISKSALSPLMTSTGKRNIYLCYDRSTLLMTVTPEPPVSPWFPTSFIMRCNLTQITLQNDSNYTITWRKLHGNLSQMTRQLQAFHLAVRFCFINILMLNALQTSERRRVSDKEASFISILRVMQKLLQMPVIHIASSQTNRFSYLFL